MEVPTNPTITRRTLPSRKPPTGDRIPASTRGRPTRLTSAGTSRSRQPEIRPLSPRDTTPLQVDGIEIAPSSIPPIVLPDVIPSIATSPNDLELRTGASTPDQVIRPASPLDEIFDDVEPTNPTPSSASVSVAPSSPTGATRRVPIPNTSPIRTPQTSQTSPRSRHPSSPPSAPQGPSSGPSSQSAPQGPSSGLSSGPSSKPKPRPKRSPPKRLQVPDFVRMSQVERTAAVVTYQKRFLNLREAFPGLGVMVIPEDYPVTPDNLVSLHTKYDGYMTHILVSDDVAQSMIILIIVLGGVEFFMTRVLGLPASNYVIKQFKLFHKYRSLLYEIGEEKIANSGGASPPMVRLIYLILLTAVATVGIRLFESTIGASGASMAEQMIYEVLGGGGSDAPSGDPTANTGGFDLNGILRFAGNFLGGGGANGPPKSETRGPTFNE